MPIVASPILTCHPVEPSLVHVPGPSDFVPTTSTSAIYFALSALVSLAALIIMDD